MTAGDTALPGGNGCYEVSGPLTELEGGSLTTTHTVQPYEIPVVTVKVLAMGICSIQWALVYPTTSVLHKCLR